MAVADLRIKEREGDTCDVSESLKTLELFR
jgi:hypothetical protein